MQSALPLANVVEPGARRHPPSDHTTMGSSTSSRCWSRSGTRSCEAGAQGRDVHAVPRASSWRLSVRLVTYALVAAYTARRGAGWKLATLLTLSRKPRRAGSSPRAPRATAASGRTLRRSRVRAGHRRARGRHRRAEAGVVHQQVDRRVGRWPPGRRPQQAGCGRRSATRTSNPSWRPRALGVGRRGGPRPPSAPRPSPTGRPSLPRSHSRLRSGGRR